MHACAFKFVHKYGRQFDVFGTKYNRLRKIFHEGALNFAYESYSYTLNYLLTSGAVRGWESSVGRGMCIYHYYVPHCFELNIVLYIKPISPLLVASCFY